MRRLLQFKYLWPTVASASLIGNAYFLYNQHYQTNTPEKVILNAFTAFSKTSNPSQTFAAVAVQAANNLGVTMYGKTIVDALTDPKAMPGRRQYEVHPFRKPGAGANAIPVYTQGDNIFVLLGRKFKNPRQKELGLEDHYILLGGYMQPHPLETTATQAVVDLDGDDKDFMEEDILRGGEGYTKQTAKSMSVSSKASEFDQSLAETAKRELAEEGSLVATDAKSIYPTGTYSTYPITNDPRLHTIVENYLFDFGDTKPNAKPGSDIAEVVWVNVTDIAPDYTIKFSEGKIAKLKDVYGPMLDDALRVYATKNKVKPTLSRR